MTWMVEPTDNKSRFNWDLTTKREHPFTENKPTEKTWNTKMSNKDLTHHIRELSNWNHQGKVSDVEFRYLAGLVLANYVQCLINNKVSIIEDRVNKTFLDRFLKVLGTG
jgi:hypothetical protein